jgi:hypothetical protein
MVVSLEWVNRKFRHLVSCVDNLRCDLAGLDDCLLTRDKAYDALCLGVPFINPYVVMSKFSGRRERLSGLTQVA